MKLKICGMKFSENICLISDLNPDFMGFIFYKKSKRFFLDNKIPNIDKNIKKVGVFVDSDLEYVEQVIKSYKLDFVQFHGDETPDLISKIHGVKTIKAFSIDEYFNFHQFDLHSLN